MLRQVNKCPSDKVERGCAIKTSGGKALLNLAVLPEHSRNALTGAQGQRKERHPFPQVAYELVGNSQRRNWNSREESVDEVKDQSKFLRAVSLGVSSSQAIPNTWGM